MSPTLELSPATFIRLQKHAVPLVDTIESVINRVLDDFETKSGAPVEPNDSPEGHATVRKFNPNTPPNLTHTKVLAIEFDGKPLARGEANWNGLLYAAIREAKARAKSPTDLKKFVIVNFVEGEKSNDGYRFLSDIGLSAQGQDANGAWRAACHIAQQLGCELKAIFIWREKEGAAFPGVTGEFHIKGRG
jgi:hypothetical protein